MVQDSQLSAKRTLFGAFDSLLDGIEEEQDSGRKASEHALEKAAKRPLLSTSETANQIQRSASDGVLQRRSEHRQELATAQIVLASEAVNCPDDQALLRPVLAKTTSDITACQRCPADLANKIGTPLLDQGARPVLFDGLNFYFFPNNDVAPARRMRIAKAIEFGATWQKQWSDCVTHVILDKSMDFKQLTRYLRLEVLPAHVIIVSETWPSECIGFRALLDPCKSQYAVKGHFSTPSPAVAKQPNSASSGTSLQVRAIKEGGRGKKTPSPEGLEAVIGEYAAESAEAFCHEMHADESRSEGDGRVLDSFPKPHVKSNADLDEAILQAKALEHVPLDNDGEDQSRPTTSEGSDSDDKQAAQLQHLERGETRMKRIEERFQCMQKHTGETSGSPNLATINILKQMADYYGQIGDEWRIRAYRRAIATLRSHDTKVCTKDEALALPNIGERLAAKIEEIVVTDRLRRLDHASAEPQDQLLRKFMKIYGAGHGTALKWVRQGFETLEELLEKADLTKCQRIGIEHYGDFESRIPRAEVEQHGDIVRTALRAIDPEFRVIIGGSYRRGSLSSGDVDCIITRPGSNASHIRAVCVEQLVPVLFGGGFLTAGLAVTSREDGSTWHGASCLPGSKVWRRIDLLFAPSNELGAALIYFTGNDIFNRSLRLLASKKGMRLNQRGLYKDVMRNRWRGKVTEGTLLEGKDEKQIFKLLGVPWRPPEHRNC